MYFHISNIVDSKYLNSIYATIHKILYGYGYTCLIEAEMSIIYTQFPK